MTTIEWTEETFNPIRARNLETGGLGHFCVKVSDGCRHCYAERLQPRYKNAIRYAAQDRAKVEVFLDDKVLRRPLSWKRSREIFPCSMTDLFGDFVPDKWIDQVMAIAALTPQHTYQVLTKRAERMYKYFAHWPDGAARRHHVFHEVHMLLNRLANKSGWSSSDPEFARAQDALKVWPLPNWRQGVSVEAQAEADERIPHLLKSDVAFRWISSEPLLQAIDIAPYLEKDMREGPKRSASLDWVVAGFESGPGARCGHVDWLRSLRDQCARTSTPFFCKQLGPRVNDGRYLVKLRDSKGGDMAEWHEDLRVRQRP